MSKSSSPPQHAWSGNEPSSSDVINYASTPRAPLIIPILLVVVIVFALVCLLIKLFRNLWDHHTKSDSYKFVDEESKQSKQLTFNINEKQTRSKNAPKLSSILLLERNKVMRRDGELNENENASFTVEANVHDSSNETNETNETSLMNHDDPEDSNIPLPNCSYISRASNYATESDV